MLDTSRASTAPISLGEGVRSPSQGSGLTQPRIAVLFDYMTLPLLFALTQSSADSAPAQESRAFDAT